MANYSHNANDLTPLMTANNAPSPSVVSDDASSALVYTVFDHSVGAVFNTSGVPGWVKFDLGSAGAAETYTISYDTGDGYLSSQFPTAWTLQGSNNDSAWDTLDTRSGQTLTAGMNTYSVSSPGSYRYYKINITAVDGGECVSLGELEYIEAEPGPEIDGNIQIIPRLSGRIMEGNMGDIDAKLTIPVFIRGTIDSPICTGDCAVTLPMLTFVGTGDDEALGIAYLNVPFLTLVADGYLSAIGDGVPQMPRLFLTATGAGENVGAALINLPRLTLSTESAVQPEGNLSVTLPMMTLTSSILSGVTGSLDRNLPFFEISATGILSIEGTASITLPLLTLDSTSLVSDYLNMVLNLKNRALTLYDNYDFNSMCTFNGKSFGATSTNIYELDTGNTDDGESIHWNFRTGNLDLHQKEKKRLKQAWFSYKSNGDLMVTVILTDGTEYEYELTGYGVNEDGVRVKFGKGIKDKYIALDVSDIDGSTIKLDVLKLHLEKIGAMR